MNNNAVLKNLAHQNGTALVLALMIVALVSAISIELSWRFELGMNRSANRWYGMQGASYFDGAETFAKTILYEDLNSKEEYANPETDTLYDIWAEEVQIPLDNVSIAGRLEDAQGRFNINSLVPPDGTPPPPPPGVDEFGKFTPSQRRFIRLLQVFQLEKLERTLTYEEARDITEAVIDWLDENSEVKGFGGAESDYYSSLDTPITIRNSLMASVSEFRVIKGVTGELYEAVLPYIIALPSDVKININTAPGPVLRTFNVEGESRPLEEEDISEFVNNLRTQKETDGFTSPDDFIAELNPPGLTNQNGKSNFVTDGIVFKSDYFLFFGDIAIGDGDKVVRGKSILQRINNDVVTVRRTDANF